MPCPSTPTYATLQRMPTEGETNAVRTALLVKGYNEKEVESYLTSHAGLRCWLDLTENCGLRRSVEDDFRLIMKGI